MLLEVGGVVSAKENLLGLKFDDFSFDDTQSSTTNPVRGTPEQEVISESVTGSDVGDWMASEKGFGWNRGAGLGASNFVRHIASGLG